MKVKQYCYFAVKSEIVSAAEVGARLGMAADVVTVLGSKRPGLFPRCHSWKLVDRDIERDSDGIGDQIQRLVDRLSPVRSRLITLTASPDISSVMRVVRYFDDPEGVQAAPADTPLDQTRHWSRAFGWHLSLPIIEFLSSTRTDLDVDEYDCGEDDSDEL